MLKNWKLLSEEEIKALNQEGLKDYLAWLKKFKREKKDELAKKKVMLSKLKNKEHNTKMIEQAKKDQEEIKKIRDEIKKII